MQQNACTEGDSKDCFTADGSKFGAALRSRFLLAEGFTNFNHGSFGSVPKVVSDAQHAYSMQCESRPDKWFRQDYFVCVDSARTMLAKYVNAPSVDDLVMVENASGAVNSVMRSMNWQEGGVILYLSSAYAMVKHTAAWLASTSNNGIVQNIEISLGSDFPMAGEESVLTPLRDALIRYQGKIKLLVISHITSVPAVTLPMKEILELARSPQMLGGSAAYPVLVDGAHALGQIHIDLQTMGDPDFYVSNAHKWLYAPKGSAFLYVRKDLQQPHFPEPTVISSSGKQDFVGRYAYTGSRDYSPFCAVVDAFKFRQALGEEQLTSYVTGLARWAGTYLAQKWDTQVLCPSHMQAFMFNVQLPTNSTAVAAALQQRLDVDYDTYIVVLPLGSLIYARLSAQVYLERSDFIRLGDLVLELLTKMPADIESSSASFIHAPHPVTITGTTSS